jgi:phosphoribosyl-AMP cyclohydrolase / phosphoribosyl-ATP pyrophosphohydrolase
MHGERADSCQAGSHMTDDERAIAEPANLDRLDFARGNGSVTVVAQDASTREVLMVAHADREALERSLSTGEMHYRSRTRGLWRKGETSGNVQRVEALFADCDGDAVLALVHPAGPACHTGQQTCFGQVPQAAADVLDDLDRTIAERDAEMRGAKHEERSTKHEASSYTQKLLADRNLLLKKLGEECAELIVACADGDRERAASEAADLYYHMLVALHSLGLGLPNLRKVLARRRKP